METDETSAASGGSGGSTAGTPVDLGAMTEEEQIAYAMRMSMQEGEWYRNLARKEFCFPLLPKIVLPFRPTEGETMITDNRIWHFPKCRFRSRAVQERRRGSNGRRRIEEGGLLRGHE